MDASARAAPPGDAEDEAFVRVMDLADHYLGCEESVCTAFSRGFLRLAEARLAMGSDRVCIESVPKAHLRATSSVSVSRAGALRFAPGLPPKREAKGTAKERGEKGSGEEAEARGDGEGAGERASSEAGFGGQGEKKAETEDAAARPDLSSIVDQLVAKYCPEELEGEEEEEEEEGGEVADGSEGGGAETEPSKATRARRRRDDPLAWFGTVVPPSLREAQREFAAAVAAAVAAAEARSKLRRALEDAAGAKDP